MDFNGYSRVFHIIDLFLLYEMAWFDLGIDVDGGMYE
jgi:hypothetical protein